MNQQAFLNMVMPFKDKVFRLAKRLLISEDEAEDATQELYYKLWKNRDKLKEYNNVEAFAMTMIKNYCLDRLKSKQANNLSIVHSNYKENNLSLDRKIEIDDSIRRVHLLIDKLPEKQRMVMQLRDIEQLEFEKIEEILQMKATAIRVTLSRARKTIREQLKEQNAYGLG
jgi:RNA polymerase sigma-70 factor (ECF subfamily)